MPKKSGYPHEAGMLEELMALGLKRPSIQKLHYSKKALQAPVVDIILKWLPGIYTDHIGYGEHLIRALLFTETAFDPRTIINLYENTDYNETLKWTMAYVLSIGRVGDLSTYIRAQLFDKPGGFARSAFLYAIEVNANFTTKKEVMHCVRCIFEKYDDFEFMGKLFRKYGSAADIPFLKERMVEGNKKKNKAIEIIIAGIESRKREWVFPKKNKFIV